MITSFKNLYDFNADHFGVIVESKLVTCENEQFKAYLPTLMPDIPSGEPTIGTIALTSPFVNAEEYELSGTARVIHDQNYVSLRSYKNSDFGNISETFVFGNVKMYRSEFVIMDASSINYMGSGISFLSAPYSEGDIEGFRNGYTIGRPSEEIMLESMTVADMVKANNDYMDTISSFVYGNPLIFRSQYEASTYNLDVFDVDSMYDIKEEPSTEIISGSGVHVYRGVYMEDVLSTDSFSASESIDSEDLTVHGILPYPAGEGTVLNPGITGELTVYDDTIAILFYATICNINKEPLYQYINIDDTWYKVDLEGNMIPSSFDYYCWDKYRTDTILDTEILPYVITRKTTDYFIPNKKTTIGLKNARVLCSEANIGDTIVPRDVPDIAYTLNLIEDPLAFQVINPLDDTVIHQSTKKNGEMEIVQIEKEKHYKVRKNSKIIANFEQGKISNGFFNTDLR